MMLDENDVIQVLAEFLQSQRYIITQQLHTSEKGVDLIATHSSGRRLHVEAKGGTSSVSGSNRFGKPYTQSQVFDRVSKGFYSTVLLRATVPTADEVALAVPDTPRFRKYLQPISAIAKSLQIQIILVGDAKRVEYL